MPNPTRLEVQLQMLRAEHVTLLRLFEAWAEQTGGTIDGLTPREWYLEHFHESLDGVLREIEAADPGLAKAMRRIIEAIPGDN